MLPLRPSFRALLLSCSLLSLVPGGAASPELTVEERIGELIPGGKATPFEPVADSEPTHIIGGRDATPGEYESYVSINLNNGYFCGGTLIRSDVVMTAGHCNLDPSVASVTISRYVQDYDFETHIHRNITNMIVHPDYALMRPLNDVALVKLDTPVFDVPLMQLNQDKRRPRNGDALTIIGLGRYNFTGDYKGAQTLQEVTVNYNSRETCIKENPQTKAKVICAKGACVGDSGGPLMSAEGVQMGIVSFGPENCAKEAPGGFTRVSALLPWIELTAAMLSSATATSKTRSNGPDQVPSSAPSSAPSSFPSDAPSVSNEATEDGTFDPFTTINVLSYTKFGSVEDSRHQGRCGVDLGPVDAEFTSDDVCINRDGNECNIGWTKAGEELTYEFSTESDSPVLSFRIRIASARTGTFVELELDGVQTSTEVEGPGEGYQAFQDFFWEDVPSIGTLHEIVIRFKTGAVNFCSISVALGS